MQLTISQESSLVALAAAGFIFAIYFNTLSPSIAGGDSGEIVAEGCQLGTAHPPGYPLITMIIYTIAHWMTWLGGSVAWRVNLFSALCTSLACYLMGRIVALHSQKAYGGTILSMGMFAFSPLIWQYANTAEVFPLNTLMTALLIFLVCRFSLTKNLNVSLLGAFVCGVALCNQHTIVLYEVPLISAMLFLQRHAIQSDNSVLIKHALCFALGLTPYLYLPISVIISGDKPGSWGRVNTVFGFFHHLLRRDYGTFQLFSGLRGQEKTEDLIARSAAYLTDMSDTQGYYVIPIFAAIALLLVTASLLRLLAEHSHPTATTSAVKKKNKAFVKKAKRANAQQASSAATDTNEGANGHDGSGNNSNSSSSSSSSDNSYAALISADECKAVPIVLLLTQLFYFSVFHSLSNLPLEDKLLYGVHQRFWMQPNVLTFIWAGVGFDAFFDMISSFFVTTTTGNKTSTTGAAGTAGATGGVLGGRSKSATKLQGRTAQAGISAVQKERKSSSSSGGSSGGSSSIGLALPYLGMAIAMAAVAAQLARWYTKMDFHDAYYFKNYALAVLNPLPQGSVLLVNYDQQWTAVRYLQVCEGVRPDITAIQLSMMTYPWFEYKRHLYPHLNFPGTYHSYPGSAALRNNGAFTLPQFLDANIKAHPIFIGGKLSYADPALHKSYNMMPIGMVSQFRPSPKPGVKVETAAYVKELLKSWDVVTETLDRRMLPDTVYQFQEDSWEWTIVRDLKDRVSESAAALLESAIETANIDPLPLVLATYWLESACVFEQEGPLVIPRDQIGKHWVRPMGHINSCRSGLIKNTGLAHVHLIQNPVLEQQSAEEKDKGPMKGLPQPSKDLFHTIETSSVQWPSNKDWKLWSIRQFKIYWGAFLRRQDGPTDPQFEQIRLMFENVSAQSRLQKKNSSSKGSSRDEKTSSEDDGVATADSGDDMESNSGESAAASGTYW